MRFFNLFNFKLFGKTKQIRKAVKTLRILKKKQLVIQVISCFVEFEETLGQGFRKHHIINKVDTSVGCVFNLGLTVVQDEEIGDSQIVGYLRKS